VPEEFKCPINLDEIHCQNCAFSKEGLCDYPYFIGENLTIIVGNDPNFENVDCIRIDDEVVRIKKPTLGDLKIVNGIPYRYVKAGKDIICWQGCSARR